MNAPLAPSNLPGFVLAAASSNSGKTTLSLGLQRLMKRAGIAVVPAKCGPDYIDPAFHAVASGRTSMNLDPWAMDEHSLVSRAINQAEEGDLLFVEGVMGLYDGAKNGAGSTANLARILGLPVILILDVKGQAQSAAAIARGIAMHDPELTFAGVMLNRVGSRAHATLLEEAFDAIGMPILGIVGNNPDLDLPSRHLGLVQASEYEDLSSHIDRIADHMAPDVNVEMLLTLAQNRANRAMATSQNSTDPIKRLPPLGQRIAIAKDAAFTFLYPHILQDWKEEGTELSFFSPLNDDVPDKHADAIYLPGGYPELHLPQLSKAEAFKAAMRQAASENKRIFGECGGYMVLGKEIFDQNNKSYPMLNLLSCSTSFFKTKLNLGYRDLTPVGDAPWLQPLRAHEFHFAEIVWQDEAQQSLFKATNASGRPLPDMGQQKGTVSGSFAHIIAAG